MTDTGAATLIAQRMIKTLYAERDEAIAERDALKAALAAALDEARDSILARLRNPDEAMVERVMFELYEDDPGDNGRNCVLRVIRALADVLAATPHATEE